MDLALLQAKINSIPWYHEFDFGNGLKTRSPWAEDYAHHRLWDSIEHQLDKIDFQGKSVLDIGCWDGYWSFYAERRGARSVLATDDQTQNASGSRGIRLTKELFNSSVRVNLSLPVYELASLGERFDVILFLGVYYHLFDPFLALAQIRHCCHRDTVVLIDGVVATALPPGVAVYQFDKNACEFFPTVDGFRQLVQAAYFREVEHVLSLEEEPPPPPAEGRLGWRWRLRTCWEVLRGSRPRIAESIAQAIAPPPPPPITQSARLFLKCLPMVGENKIHAYKPPFGLHQYDERFGRS